MMAKVTSQTTQKVEKGMAGKRSLQAAAEISRGRCRCDVPW